MELKRKLLGSIFIYIRYNNNDKCCLSIDIVMFYVSFSYIYHNFEDALVALNNMVILEIERGRFFYVDNDFYDNKYPPNMYGKYFCIMERNVTQWEKYESVSAKSKNSKNNQCKILMFRQKIK